MVTLPSPLDLLRLPGRLLRLARALFEIAVSLPRTLGAVQRIDETLREIQASVANVERVVQRAEGWLARLEPAIEELLADPTVRAAPETLRRLQEEVVPLLSALGGTVGLLGRIPGINRGPTRRPDVIDAEP